jgi:hypothetical protein
MTVPPPYLKFLFVPLVPSRLPVVLARTLTQPHLPPSPQSQTWEVSTQQPWSVLPASPPFPSLTPLDLSLPLSPHPLPEIPQTHNAGLRSPDHDSLSAQKRTLHAPPRERNKPFHHPPRRIRRHRARRYDRWSEVACHFRPGESEDDGC